MLAVAGLAMGLGAIFAGASRATQGGRGGKRSAAMQKEHDRSYRDAGFFYLPRAEAKRARKARRHLALTTKGFYHV